jgi:hypothetical protein
MRGRRTAAVLVLVGFLSLVWIDLRVITGTPNQKDAAGYEQIAVGLARTGVFAQGGVPTRTAEPVHIALLALQVRIDPRLTEARETGVVAAGAPSRAVKQQNLLWSAALLSGVAVQALLLRSGRRDRVVVAALAMGAVTLLLLENVDVVDRNLAELPAAALVVWTGVAATELLRRRSVPVAAGVGVMLGLLVLTRAAFLYVSAPYLVILLLLVAREDRRSDSTSILMRVGPLVLATVVAFVAVVGPWALRNQTTFGDPGLTERGGEILHLRAAKNSMDAYQHRGAWVYWAPLPMQGPLARALRVDRDDFRSGRPLAPVARYDDEVDAFGESFYRSAKNAVWERRVELMALGLSDAEAREQAEDELGALALAQFRDRPTSFLRTTPVFLWRFLWPMNSSLTVPRPLLAIVNLAGMAALVWAAVSGLLRRPVLFAVAGLPAGATAFYALVTHAIPRYARPLAPTMILLLVLASLELRERLRRSGGAARIRTQLEGVG